MSDFKAEVYKLVAQIPPGRVMTYGQIAALCGKPRAARIVGGIAHFGPTHLHTNPDCFRAELETPPGFSAKRVVETSGARSPYQAYGSLRSSASPSASSECEVCGGKEIPWQRVVKKSGDLASGYYGGRAGHKQDLEREGVKVSDAFTIDIKQYLWWPEVEDRN